jgi:hypothetical protein
MARAEAGSPESYALGEPGGGASGFDSSDGLGDAGTMGTGEGFGMDGLSGLDASGGSGAGDGSLERRGPSEAGDFRSRQVKVPTDEFGDPSISSGQSADEGPIGEATVDYRQVLADYRSRATESMAQRYIPPSLKDLVAAYFTSLDSGGSTGGSTR